MYSLEGSEHLTQRGIEQAVGAVAQAKERYCDVPREQGDDLTEQTVEQINGMRE